MTHLGSEKHLSLVMLQYIRSLEKLDDLIKNIKYNKIKYVLYFIVLI